MNYNRLETSLIDVIKEEQAKLGYMKEKISLYYPLSSLNHFFGNETDAAGMIEILKELFHSYSDKIITEPMDNEEFDVMIRFDDGSDPYYYCFKDEGCHIIYHRFLPEDYADFGF